MYNPVIMRAILCVLMLIGRLFYWDIILRANRALRSGDSFYRFHFAFMRDVTHKTIDLTHMLTGLRLRIRNDIAAELPPRMIVVANHQSLADIPIILEAFPDHDIRFVAKSELGVGIPLISPTLRFGRHALIPRSGGFSYARHALLRLLRRPGVSPVMFPEGTRSKDGSLGRFHAAGVSVLALSSDLPLVAVALDGGYRLRTITNLNRIGQRLDYRVRVLSVHPSPENKSQVEATLHSIRDEIKRQIAVWRGEDG